jgi:hypothetical protein
VKFINDLIDKAPVGDRLHGMEHAVDPSNEIQLVLVKCVEWNILSREWDLSSSEFEVLQEKSVELLEVLKEYLPDKSGEKSQWNFEKAHSILHKVRDLMMWGWSELTSCQGPEHAHIDIIKSVAHLTNNKDIFLCILRYHARRAHIQHLELLLEDISHVPAESGCKFDAPADEYDNDSAACEAGIRYPTLQAMVNREHLHLRQSSFKRQPMLDLFRLKPSEVGALAYRFRDAHPMLRWLPSKLSEWVAENLRSELGFPDKRGARWEVQELNAILQEHLVMDKNGNSLECFGCVRWESDLYRGFMRARCYPFKLPELRFYNQNPQVLCTKNTLRTHSE